MELIQQVKIQSNRPSNNSCCFVVGTWGSGEELGEAADAKGQRLGSQVGDLGRKWVTQAHRATRNTLVSF